MIEKNGWNWIVLSLLAGLLLLSSACSVEEATQAVGDSPEATSSVPTPIVKQPGSTSQQEEQVEQVPSPVATETTEPQQEPEAAPSDPTAVVVDDITLPTPAHFERETAFTLGDPNAPLTVVEFTDYQCPYCAQFAAQIWPQVREQLVETGEIYWVLKDFPLDQLHPQARLAAQAARCAAEQDAFWDMHDALFARQKEWAEQENAAEVLVQIAADLSLNEADVEQCLRQERYADQIEADLNDGLEAGVRGTPSFFFNGYYNSGVLPYDAFATILGWAKSGELEQVIAESIKRAQATPTPVPEVDVPVGDAPAKGDPDAPVVIIEYSEYQCPYCKRYVDETLTKIDENYIQTGKVYYAFKDFPLDSIHPNARPAAMAAHCAREHDAYWEMHDLLFDKQREWSSQSNPRASLVGYAKELGINADEFGECLDNQRYDGFISANQQEGLGFGVQGTPAFFVNGKFLSGAQPYSAFEAAIEAALSE